ncbi:MAG TPA: glycoside hydrolase domain-containing protein [Acidobacteriaceae bacterium]|nr:glycoside hydrolase domain-containing protein [Acidobacteriaceae bacterium]
MRLFRIAAIMSLAATCVTGRVQAQSRGGPKVYLGFDANEYPGDGSLAALHRQFSFTGYWLNNPPGANHNPWVGKREVLRRAGFGFVVVFNGRLDEEILAAKRTGKAPEALARDDASAAVGAARREGFPAGTIIFLDQEEGGRMLPEQAAYLLGWTEAVAHSVFKPGVYASGQPVPDEDESGHRITITTIQDIRAHVAAQHLHPIAFWAFRDGCPPAPGCVVDPAKLRAPDVSGTLDLAVWQYALSPHGKYVTRACSATYSRDGNCYLPVMAHFQIDLNSADSPDPSHGR